MTSAPLSALSFARAAGVCGAERSAGRTSTLRTALLVALALPTAAAAQDAPDIVVLGGGLPLPPGTPAYGSVELRRDRLTGDASGRVEDVLLDIAGFQQFRRSDSRSANPSAQGVTLRALGGNASSRALVLLDGVPIADPFFGYVPFNALQASDLAGIRVTRGGGSGPFGAGAVAGTIELASATRGDLPRWSADLSGGSFGSVTASGTVAPDIGGGFVALSGRFERSDGFFTAPAPGANDARAAFRDGSGTLRAVAPIDPDTQVQARATLFTDRRTLRFRGADSKSDGLDTSVRLVHRGRWGVDALAYLQARDFANKVVSATTLRLTLDQRATPSTGTGGKLELRPPVGAAHLLRLGVDARRADGALAEDAYAASGIITARRSAGGATSTTGAFAEDDWTLGRLVLTGGARVDRWTITHGFFREATPAGAVTTDRSFVDRSGTVATGRAGAVLRANDALAVRAAGYTGFRLPTLNELYRPFVVFPITTQANASLAPERLRGGEIGVDLRPARGVRLSLTAFDNRLGGAIANVTIGTNVRQRRNVQAIHARGIEATLAARRGAVSLDTSYAYSDSRVEAPGMPLDGLAPAQSPRHSASATLAWNPRSGLGLSATLRHVGAQYEDDLQSDVLPAATTLDAVARLPLGPRLALVARAENLLDAQVVTRNSGGSVDLGTPRTLWLGVRLSR